MVDRDEQAAIAFSPIVSTLAGISMEVSAESKKAPSSIVFSFDPFSKVMVDRDEQTEIAFS